MELGWLEYLKQSGWLDVLKVVGPSSVISAAISIGWSAWRDAGQRRADRKVTACPWRSPLRDTPALNSDSGHAFS
jgi:hypothetical protein